jgi:hypothetical protein
VFTCKSLVFQRFEFFVTLAASWLRKNGVELSPAPALSLHARSRVLEVSITCSCSPATPSLIRR